MMLHSLGSQSKKYEKKKGKKMVLTQKEMSELCEEIECENKEQDQRECMMRDIDCFMESDVVADAVAKLKEIKELCKMYGA